MRKRILVPLLEKNEPVYIDLDGLPEFSARFRKNAFSALVSKDGYCSSYILDQLEFVSVTGEISKQFIYIVRCSILNPKSTEPNYFG